MQSVWSDLVSGNEQRILHIKKIAIRQLLFASVQIVNALSNFSYEVF